MIDYIIVSDDGEKNYKVIYSEENARFRDHFEAENVILKIDGMVSPMSKDFCYKLSEHPGLLDAFVNYIKNLNHDSL